MCSSDLTRPPPLISSPRFISYHIQAAHQLDSNWPNRPTEWWPDRWVQGDPNGGATSTYAFIPFSYGPRRCLGERLALAEARLVVANLVRHFRINVPRDGFQPRIEVMATMKTVDGVRVTLVERERKL